MCASEWKRAAKPVPICDRIRKAWDEVGPHLAPRSARSYTKMLWLVFPEAEFPDALNYSSNGGPAGAAMAFGAALRRMGWQLHGGGNETRTVTR